MARKLVVEVVADTSKLERGFREASRSAGQLGRQTGQLRVGFGAIAKGTAGVIGVTSAFNLLGGAVRSGISDLEESARANAQTTAAIRSTGGVANVTAGQVGDLAQSLSNVSGIDDEVIQGGENMLLTFKNIRNEVGAGNDIFDQATQALEDMSVATGTDMTRGAIQLGKALNDPIRGITALSRVGVTFNESQRAMVKRLATTGQTMEAQKIILRELRTEFGGSAEMFGTTMPGKLAKLKNAFDNMASGILGNASPAFGDLVDRAVAWMQSEENQRRVAEDARQIFDALGDVLRTLAKALKTLNDITGSTKDTVKLFIAVWAGFKITALIRNLGLVATAETAIGTNAEASTGKVAGLRGALTGLRGLGAAAAVTGFIELEMHPDWKRKIEDKIKAATDRLPMGPLKAFGKILTIHPFGPDYDEQAAAENARKAGERVGGSLVTGLQTSMGKLPAGGLAVGPFGQTLQPEQRQGFDVMTDEEIAKRDKAMAANTARVRALHNTWFDNDIQRKLMYADAIRAIPAHIAALEKIKGLLEARAKATKDVTRAHNLEDQAFQIQQQIVGLQDQANAEAAQAAADAAAQRDAANQSLLDALQFGIEKAEWTKTTNDNIAAQRAYIAGLEQVLKSTDDTAETMRELARARHDLDVMVREKAAAETKKLNDALAAYGKTVDTLTDQWKRVQDKERRHEVRQREAAKQRAKTREQTRQFRVLGLDPSGDEPIPTTKALQRRLRQIRAGLEGTEFDTPKVRSRLSGIAKLFRQALHDPLKKLTPETRKAIDDYYDTITKASDKGTKKFVGFQHFSSRRIAKQFHLTELTGPELRRARAAIRFAAGGAPRGTAAFAGAHGGAGVHVGTVNVYNTHRVGDLENQLTKRQASRPHHRRGSR